MAEEKWRPEPRFAGEWMQLNWNNIDYLKSGRTIIRQYKKIVERMIITKSIYWKTFAYATNKETKLLAIEYKKPIAYDAQNYFYDETYLQDLFNGNVFILIDFDISAEW